MSVLDLNFGARSYQIFIEKECIKIIGSDLKEKKIGNRYAIITDDNVMALYGTKFLDYLNEVNIPVEIFSITPGEESKSLKTLGELAGKLALRGYDRKDALIAFGGGVVGDITGFFAATYMRGIPFIQVPTTLLAQVDSSVGGKTGVDIPEGKNLLGVFYQPKAVYIDTGLLRSLPHDELLGGLAEVIKYGVIWDSNFFQYLESHCSAILNLDEKVIQTVVENCCKIKAEIVARDEREGDLRRILNFGHTIGHALEAASDFSMIHGLAVSRGMVAAAKISVLSGVMGVDQLNKIISLLLKFGMPTEIPKDYDKQRIKKYILTDKKIVSGKVHYVLPQKIGSTTIVADIDEAIIDQVLS